MSDKKWQTVDEYHIDANNMLVHSEWPHEARGGNHKGEQHICVVYTHPKEGWSTAVQNASYWGNRAVERAEEEFNKRVRHYNSASATTTGIKV